MTVILENLYFDDFLRLAILGLFCKVHSSQMTNKSFLKLNIFPIFVLSLGLSQTTLDEMEARSVDPKYRHNTYISTSMLWRGEKFDRYEWLVERPTKFAGAVCI